MRRPYRSSARSLTHAPGSALYEPSRFADGARMRAIEPRSLPVVRDAAARARALLVARGWLACAVLVVGETTRNQSRSRNVVARRLLERPMKTRTIYRKLLLTIAGSLALAATASAQEPPPSGRGHITLIEPFDYPRFHLDVDVGACPAGTWLTMTPDVARPTRSRARTRSCSRRFWPSARCASTPSPVSTAAWSSSSTCCELPRTLLRRAHAGRLHPDRARPLGCFWGEGRTFRAAAAYK